MAKRIRVLIMGPHPGVMGGISAVIVEHLRSSLGQHVDLRFVASHVDGSAFRKLLQAIVALFQLLIVSIAGRVDIVHIHTSHGASFLRKAVYHVVARCLGKRTVLHVHGSMFVEFYRNGPKWLRSCIQTTLSTANAVLALSPQWAADLRNMAPGAHIHVVPNGVRIEGRLQPELSNSYFLFLGRIGQRKGSYDIVRALERTGNPHIHVVFAGDGEGDGVATLARELGVERQVSIRSWVRGTEKEELLEGATGFVLPSYNEGLPMALLEAMAAGLPAISTPVGGIPEVVIHDQTGLLVPPGDVDSLAEALKTLYDNRGTRQRLGKSGRELVSQRYGTEASIESIVKVYNEIT